MGLAMLREQARGLTRDQRNAFFAAWLGWAMDAFDYFLLVFVISDVAKDFDTTKTKVAVATMLIALRCLYGVGMGGEWGLGASLAMEKIPVEKRGFFSGVLQQGYPVGYM